jgi:hypothetical protein
MELAPVNEVVFDNACCGIRYLVNGYRCGYR